MFQVLIFGINHHMEETKRPPSFALAWKNALKMLCGRLSYFLIAALAIRSTFLRRLRGVLPRVKK